MIDSVLCGKLLGDGNLSLEAISARLKFKHRSEDALYLFEILSTLMDYQDHISFGPNIPYPIIQDDQRTNNTYEAFESVSLRSEYLTKLYRIWYQNGEKTVPRKYVERHLDAHALAIWFQDDGCLKSVSRITISTDSFELEDIEFLSNLLWDKFHIHSTIDSDKRIDISSKRHVELFLYYIRPYLSDTMRRKFPYEYYSNLGRKVTELFIDKKKHELKREKKNYNRRKFIISEEAYTRIEGKGSVVFNSLITRLLTKELFRVCLHDYRVKRIKETIYSNDETFAGEGVLRQNQSSRQLMVDVSDFIDRGLDILKEWTGITRNEYIELFLKGKIPEVDMFTVVQLSELTDAKRTTIQNYLKKYGEYFPSQKISKQFFYTKEAIDVIRELQKHKGKPEKKIRPILEEKFLKIEDMRIMGRL